MRGLTSATILAVFMLALLGVLTMPTDAAAEEKKFPPLPRGAVKFDEKVTVKWYDPQNKKWRNTKEDVNALRFTGSKESKCFYLKAEDVQVKIQIGSHIIDSDGNTYEVYESPGGTGEQLVRVKLKK